MWNVANGNENEYNGNQNIPRAIKSDKLMQSEFGITPVSDMEEHQAPRPHVHPQHFERGKELVTRGRRHFDPHHVSLTDDAKREQGRFGKMHVHDTPQGRGEASFNIFSSDEGGVKQERPKTNTRRQTTSTSMQLSESRLRKIAENQRYREEALNALKYVNQPIIVLEEERLSRRIAAELYAAGSSARCSKLQEQHRSVDLGPPSNVIQERVPFALDKSAPRYDNQQEHRGTYYRNIESKPQDEQLVRRCDAGRYHLRDNVALWDNEYPDPPSVGVRVAPRVASRPNTAQIRSNNYIDENIMRRAKARCRESARERMPDFIFGEPEPLREPKRTLREVTEDRWRDEANCAAKRRTGRAMTHQSHKATALW